MVSNRTGISEAIRAHKINTFINMHRIYYIWKAAPGFSSAGFIREATTIFRKFMQAIDEWPFAFGEITM